MRKFVSLWTIWLALAAVVAPCAQAQTSVIARANTAWGRFEPGAWSRVRIVIETLAADGTVADKNTTVQTTTLVSVGRESVELKVDATVEVAGKQFDAPSQVVRQLFGGQPISASAEVTSQLAGEGKVTIEEKVIPCQVEQAEIVEKAGKTLAKTYYAETTFPHVLRVELVTTDDKGETTSQTVGEVIALAMPHTTAAGATHDVAVWQERTRKANGALERSLGLRAAEIPGGVVARWSKELDAEGRLVRRSMLELIDFGTKESAP